MKKLIEKGRPVVILPKGISGKQLNNIPAENNAPNTTNKELNFTILFSKRK